MKKSLLAILILNLSVMLFAVPGFESYIPETPGSFVYYRDNSFTRESYIGIINYNDVMYQIRYYAPFDGKQGLPEKEIALVLTVNPDSNFWDVTGERILSQIKNDSDDVDIVNYLHDILYDFSAKRNKIDLTPARDDYKWNQAFWQNGLFVKQDYEQFGGNVTINYDVIIPIFNIKSIITPDGKAILQACIFGYLTSNEDTTFEEFKGFPEYNEKNDSTKAVTYKKGKAVKHTFNNHSVTIDKHWETFEDMPNCCVLNNDAVIIMLPFPVLDPDPILNNFKTIFGSLCSKNYNYFDLSKCDFIYNEKKGSYKIVIETYQQLHDAYMVNTQYIAKNDTGSYDAFSLNSYKKPWLVNQSYFNKIINSYK